MAKEKKTEVTEQAEVKQSKPTESVLEKVGKSAIKEHNLKEVFVTSDGVCFKLESDAKNHALNLSNRQILTVKK